MNERPRRLPIGAEVVPGGGVSFRVWAPAARRAAVVIHGPESAQRGPTPLTAQPSGYWTGVVGEAGAGTRYTFRLDGSDRDLPDPASRYQPEGPHGPSEVIDPGTFAWTDGNWTGARLPGQVFYEMHVGTFTPAGTWGAAVGRLPHLLALGVTAIELMPVVEFAGEFGWGYDGVDLFAPYHRYGRPDDFRQFIDHAHRLGLAVILDAVYNHLGPDGNYLGAFAPAYFAGDTEWGQAINFDGEDSAPVREFFLENAAYWISEFHADGLRLDATHAILDRSPEHIVAQIARRARQAAGGREILIAAENERQRTELVHPPSEGGAGLDALWNDDFHHSAQVALTGRSEAYYRDHRGTPQELLSAMKRGFLFQGQRYAWQGQRRGSPTGGVPPAAFITFIENHDQVANSALGHRVWQMTSPGRHRAMTALLLLGPWTPLLLQGQEWNASTPFLYFADSNADLAPLVRAGRGQFLAQFESYATREIQERLPEPATPATFERCRLDWSEPARAPHEQALALHGDLLLLRRTDPVVRAQATGGVTLDGAVIGPECFVARFFAPAADDRLLIVNLGARLDLSPAPEPLLAPPRGARWQLMWSSEDPRYGGNGTPTLDSEDRGWQIPAQNTALLAPTRNANHVPDLHNRSPDRLAPG